VLGDEEVHNDGFSGCLHEFVNFFMWKSDTSGNLKQVLLERALDGLETEKKTSVVLVRKRTIPIERSPPVSEASANFSG
jgi:hypothetical protein